jgi:hypothetical protein
MSVIPCTARLLSHSPPPARLRPPLVERGIDLTAVYHGPGSPFFPAARIPGPDPERARYNSYASFEDPDGNGWTLQEITTRLPGRAPEE